MGLIMLILIGAAPAAYALNRAIPESTTPMFLQATQDAESVFSRAGANKCAVQRCCPSPRHVGEALKTKPVNRPEVYAALATLTADIAQQVETRRHQGRAGGPRHPTFAMICILPRMPCVSWAPSRLGSTMAIW